MNLTNLTYDFWHSIFPKNCLGCSVPIRGSELNLCVNCLKNLTCALNDHHAQDSFGQKFTSIPEFSWAAFYLEYVSQSPVQKMIHAIKYRNYTSLAIELGRTFGESLDSKSLNHFDLLIPVPLHSSRLAMRGYNQSDLISEGLSQGLEIPWSEKIVKRLKATTTQTRKHKVERWKNVEKVFEVIDNQKVKGNKFLLVDDVVTTGSTVLALAETLVESGAKEIGVLALSAG